MPTPRSSSFSANEILASMDQSVRRDFEANRRILSFEEYLALLAEQPDKQTRGSARYLADLMDYYGREEVASPGAHDGPDGQEGRATRFRLFDEPSDSLARKVVGQEEVQNRIFRAVRAFSQQGINNKLVLLHGPNGSAKTSTVHAIMGAMERYSRENEGAIYGFSWVFPVERYTKSGIGLNTYAAPREPVQNYSKLPDDEIAAQLSCDLRDHPFLLVPREQRRSFLEKLMSPEKARALWESMPQYLTHGDLCHRCRLITDALLTSNNGDFRKVLMHVRVERFYFSRRYRRGLVTIEPQLHVDAQYHQLTYNRSMGSLPASLQCLNLFTLTGDIVDGNRGLIEYSDLLKRPVDSFKYLLTACETGSINVGSSIAYLDTVMLGSTNEIQLDAFKEFPDFTSFKARIELIRVPYLLAVGQEAEIYAGQLPQFAGDKHVAPHVAWTAGLWSVLTRLKKPNSINYSPTVSALVANLTPIEKARLYDTGEVPSALPAEDRKVLRSAIRRIREEYANIPYYEGRMGASAREVKSILFDAAQNSEFRCLSPLAAMRQMEEFVKRVTEYEFLKQDVKDGYHDAHEFIQTVRAEYLNVVDREVRGCMGLYDSAQWEEFLKRYVQHAALALKKEKHKNPITGKMEDPDFALIDEFEAIVCAPGEPPGDAATRDAFRQNIISQIGAWRLDHPKDQIVYAQVFPDFWRKLEQHFFESQKSVLSKMHDALIVYESPDNEPWNRPGGALSAGRDSEGAQLARQTVENMKAQHGYCDHCAKEVISFLMKSRY